MLIIIKTVQTCGEEVLYAETTFHARSVRSTVRHCITCAVILSAGRKHKHSEKSFLRLHTLRSSSCVVLCWCKRSHFVCVWCGRRQDIFKLCFALCLFLRALFIGRLQICMVTSLRHSTTSDNFRNLKFSTNVCSHFKVPVGFTEVEIFNSAYQVKRLKSHWQLKQRLRQWCIVEPHKARTINPGSSIKGKKNSTGTTSQHCSSSFD